MLQPVAPTRSLPPVRYFRAGGFSQLVLETAEDLRLLPFIDQTLWVASSCPTKGLEYDERTLQLMDSDKDGRIRCPEIIEASRWLLRVLRDTSALTQGTSTVRLDQINAADPDGARVLESARRVLLNLGKPDAQEIALADVMDVPKIYAQVQSNGDGVIPVEAGEDAATKAALEDIIKTLGGVPERGGDVGVDQKLLESFFKAVDAYAGWWAEAHPAPGQENPKILPLGADGTAAAHAALQAVCTAMDSWFTQARLSAYDPRAAAALLAPPDKPAFEPDLSPILTRMPVAPVRADGVLDLSGPVNPAFSAGLAALRQRVLVPLLGSDAASLTLEDWERVKAALAPYGEWLARKKGAEVEKLGVERVTALAAGTERVKIQALILQDLAISKELNAVTELERLLRYHRDLFTLVNNFVAMPAFYGRDETAIFQAGTLIMEGCAMHLCVTVHDRAKHAALAAKSGIFLLYCELRRAGEPNRVVCAALTAGEVRRITEGKNGIFYDRQGRDWDATVVQLLRNPISLMEATVAPFKTFGQVISDQFQKLTATRQKALQTSVDEGFNQFGKQVPQAPTQVQAQAVASQAGAGMGGILAGGGVAVAALSSSFAFITSTLAKINTSQAIYGAVLLLTLVVVPSVILAAFRLHARDLGMVLEACGWAINGRMRLSFALARNLTRIGRFPLTARRSYSLKLVQDDDPRKRLTTLVAVLIAVASATGGVLWWTW